jgi:hypothetical protein
MMDPRVVLVSGAIQNLNQVNLGVRAFEYLGHVTPSLIVPSPYGRDV